MDFNKAFSLEGKVALVTGGTYGIGFAIGSALAQAGAKVVYNCRSEPCGKTRFDHNQDGSFQVEFALMPFNGKEERGCGGIDDAQTGYGEFASVEG